MKGLTVFAALMLGISAQAEDLLAVYAQARSADPYLAMAAAQSGVRQEQAVQARAALLPQWQLQATQGRLTPGGADGRQVTSSISQSLLDLSAMRTYTAAQSAAEGQVLRLRAAEAELCARVAQAYFGVLGAQAALRTAEANEAAFATQVAQADARYQAGLAALIDVEQSRTFHELSRGTTFNARAALADARQALAEITGRKADRLNPLAAELPVSAPVPADAEAWVAQALAANPALRAAQADLRSSEQRVGAARAAHLPTVAVSLDHTRASGAFSNGIAGSQGQIALRLTVPLFAGGATQAQTRQALYQRDAQREQLEADRRALVRETQAQYQGALTAVSLLNSTRRAVGAADRSLAATQSGVALGTRGTTDLLLAIQSQANAQMAHEQARTRYVMATLLLRRAAGALGEAELATVNGWLKGD